MTSRAAGGFHRPDRVAVVTVSASSDQATDAGKASGPRVYLSTMPSGEVLVLQRPAADIWTAAVEVHDPQAVITAVAEVFGVEPDEIRGDVLSFLDELRDRGLLEWRDPP